MPWAYWLHEKSWHYGDAVFSIGHPHSLYWTLTSGEISHPHRLIDDHTTPSGFGLIQTDAAMNQGSSGGGLFLTTGEFIGINDNILTPMQGSEANIVVNNIAFARPLSSVRNFFRQLAYNGEVLPRNIQVVSPNRHGQLTPGEGLKLISFGNYVSEENENVIAVNGVPITSYWGFMRTAWSVTNPSVTLTVRREDNTLHKVEVVLAAKASTLAQN